MNTQPGPIGNIWDIHWTPTQRRMMVLLDNRRPVPLIDLKACIEDELTGITGFHYHMSCLREKLRGKGHSLACINVDNNIWYQLVLSSSPDVHISR